MPKMNQFASLPSLPTAKLANCCAISVQFVCQHYRCADKLTGADHNHE